MEKRTVEVAGEAVSLWVVFDPMDRGSSHRRRLAPDMAREVAELADQLRRQGIKDPVRQAQNTLAERWKFASGKALNRWLRRNR
jgi:hypothetical protein